MLYFGIQIDPKWWSKWLAIPEERRALFLQETDLEKIEDAGMSYIGKRCGHLILFEQLDLIKMHILSVFSQLIPHFDVEHQLFTLLLID